MPNQNNPRRQELSRYDEMDTEALRQLLREDALKPEGEESDTETILYIMEVLAKREDAKGEGKSPEEAWMDFQQRYLPQSSAQSQKHPWKRSLIAAAAAVVILIGGTVSANGFGSVLWDTVISWSEETFHLSYSGQTSEPQNFQADPTLSKEEFMANFQEGLQQLPTWFPEDYTFTSSTVYQTPAARIYTALYTADRGEVVIRVGDYIPNHPMEYEYSGSLLEIYQTGGTKYYICHNLDALTVAWLKDGYECGISGDITLSELKQIIDSIGG